MTVEFDWAAILAGGGVLLALLVAAYGLGRWGHSGPAAITPSQPTPVPTPEVAAERAKRDAGIAAEAAAVEDPDAVLREIVRGR